MTFIIENLPIIICAVVGIALLLFEMFMPGFGVPGIAGIAFLLASIILTWNRHGAYAGLGATLIVFALTALMVSFAFKSTTSGRIWRSDLVLKGSMPSPEEIDDGVELEQFLNKVGVTQTVLRPAGIVDIEGTRLNVVSRGDFIPKGEQVLVEEVEGKRVVVRRVEEKA